MNNKKNFMTALILQMATMISGLILPRLIISTFGSEINGLSSSITQFLSFISLLEGGLGAVILAELYKPIEESNTEKIKQILYVSQDFFKKLALIFIAYTIILSCIYPLYIFKSYEFIFTFSLVWILSLTTLVQYLFSITNKLLLQACQKVYIVNLVMTGTVLLNLILAVAVMYIYPEIHIIKFISAIVYLIQPVLYSHFIEKQYSIRKYKIKQKKNTVLKNLWSGFTQNLAYFINMNTDIAVLTVFATMTDVSVYSVYMLSIAALRAIIISVTNSYQSALGKYYAEGKLSDLREKFYKFESSFWILGIILFSTCLVLINPFVQLYTTGVHDANYYRPIFAILIVIANMIYCVREPYRLLILAVGKFRETNFGSVAEAIINISISIALVSKLGLVGVAIGTLIAITYRLIYFIWFLKKDILFIPYKRYTKLIITFAVVLSFNVWFYISHPVVIYSFVIFLIYGCIVLIIEAAVTVVIFKVMDRIQNKLIRSI